MLKTLNKAWDCLKSKTRSKDIFEIIKLKTLLKFQGNKNKEKSDE